jgi:hypothetical protein
MSSKFEQLELQESQVDGVRAAPPDHDLVPFGTRSVRDPGLLIPRDLATAYLRDLAGWLRDPAEIRERAAQARKELQRYNPSGIAL